jgi:hypothetical protein
MRASTFRSVRKGLRVTPGDLRVSSHGVRLAHQTAVHSAAGAFVQAVMERYKGRQTRWSSLDLVFTKRFPGVTVSPLYRELRMHVAPRLNLTILGETRTVHQRSTERVERTLLAQFVHDLGVRGKRIEAVAIQTSPPARGLSTGPSRGASTDLQPARGLSTGPSRGASTDLPLGWPVSTVVRRPVTESAPDNRGLPPATAATRPWWRQAVHAEADQTLSPLVPRTAPGEARPPVAPRRAASVSHSPADEQGAIARLIEQTARPVRLLGLEMRLVSPEKPPSGTRRPAEVSQDEGPTTAATPLQPPVPTAPSPAALDINAISEKVYDRLLRRQRLERERRGLY